MKDYLYNLFDGVKSTAKNISAKLAPIEESFNKITALKQSAVAAFDENKSLSKAINTTLESAKKVTPSKISQINDIAGLKQLVADLKTVKTEATDALGKVREHKANLEKLSQEALETAKNVKATAQQTRQDLTDALNTSELERFEGLQACDEAQGELIQLADDSEDLTIEAEKRIRELELEEKDEAAEVSPDTNPQQSVQECPNKPKCDFDNITIKDKANREIIFSANGSAKQPKTLYVISGDKKDYDETIELSAKGSCKSGSECPKLEFQGGQVNETGVTTLGPVSIKSEKIVPTDSWREFFAKFIVPDMKKIARPQIYTVQAGHCDCAQCLSGINVVAFPPAGWSGSLELAYKEKDDDKRKAIIEKNKDLKDMTEAESLGGWELGCSLKAYLDDEDYSYKPPEKFLTSVQECMNKMTPLLGEIDNEYVSVKIGWPNIKLSGGIDLTEHPSNPFLTYAGEIVLDADPLISIDCDVDIKAIIIRLLAKHEVFSDYLIEILAKVEKGYDSKNLAASGKIEVKLKTNADIRGKQRWHRTAKDGQWMVDQAQSSLTGSMGIELYGAVHVEGRAFFVRAAAGASISVRSKDGKDKSRFTVSWAALEGAENPIIERQMKFNGLAIYYTAYFEFGTDGSATGDAVKEAVLKKKRRSGGDKANKKNENETENLIDKGNKELKQLCILMDEWVGGKHATILGQDEI